MARRFLVTIKSSISALKVHSEPTMMICLRQCLSVLRENREFEVLCEYAANLHHTAL